MEIKYNNVLRSIKLVFLLKREVIGWTRIAAMNISRALFRRLKIIIK